MPSGKNPTNMIVHNPKAEFSFFTLQEGGQWHVVKVPNKRGLNIERETLFTAKTEQHAEQVCRRYAYGQICIQCRCEGATEKNVCGKCSGKEVQVVAPVDDDGDD